MDEAILVFGSPHCGACMMFKRKLTAANKAFAYSDDIEQLAAAASESGLAAAPIVKIGTTYYTAADAARYLKI